MNLYKGLLYTQGYLLDPQYADDADAPSRRTREERARAERREAEQAQAQRLPATPPGRTRVVASCG